MAAFLRELILILTAVTLMEHLMPSGPMGRTGRLVLGLVLILSAAQSLLPLTAAQVQPAAFMRTGEPYAYESYVAIAREAWEAGDGS